MYVVTEYGVVNLKGKSVAERARALISLARIPISARIWTDGSRKPADSPRRFV